MSSLYQITGDFLKVQDMLEKGLIDEADDTLESIEGDWEDKAENVVKMIRSLNADASVYKEESDYYADKARTATSRAQHLQDYLYKSMKMIGKERATAGNFKLAIAKNGGKLKLHIDDPTHLPMQYQKMTFSPDNEKLREALDKGEHITGVWYEERGDSLRIK